MKTRPIQVLHRVGGWSAATLALLALLLLTSAVVAGINVRSGATLTVHSNLVDNTSGVTVEGGAKVEVTPGGVVTGDTLTVATGGTVRLCGTLRVNQVLNSGLLLADCGIGQTAAVSGEVVNDGRVRVSHGTAYDFFDITNNGIFDSLTSATQSAETLNGFGGSLFDQLRPGVMEMDFNDATAIYRITVESVAPHRYTLQYSPDGTLSTWLDAGLPALTGTDGLLSFTVPEELRATRSFFQIIIGD